MEKRPRQELTASFLKWQKISESLPPPLPIFLFFEEYVRIGSARFVRDEDKYHNLK